MSTKPSRTRRGAVGRVERERSAEFIESRLLAKPAPSRSRDQPIDALRQANKVRIRRAELKKEIAAGNKRLEKILARPPEWLTSAKVYELLLAVPKIGPATATRILARCRIAHAKTVGGLSERQRRELANALKR